MTEIEFNKKIESAYSGENLKQIKSALTFVESKFSDDAFMFNHAINTAATLVDFGLDSKTVVTGLICRVPDKVAGSLKEIKELFGEEIYNLVLLCFKVNNFDYDSESKGEFDNLRQMLLAIGKDIRVILVKICDRFDEMNNLNYFPKEKQIELARETWDIFVPLIERLGMNKMRSDIEDICFKTLNPNEYNALKQDLDAKFHEKTKIMSEIENNLKGVLKRLNINGVVTSRFKHFYSVYKKIKKAGIDKIYDIIALRIIVDEEKDCYACLGEIHSLYKPIPGRIKDYIASPKPNGYKSLHTTLLTKDGVPFEVQIRTREMHEFCEYGIAAHWRYKEGKTKLDQLEERINWFRKTLEDESQIKDDEKFVNAVKMDLATGEIWVFTPKRKPISLPENATPVDFAYAIHSGVGNKCVGAKVNDKMVPLSYVLSTGDVVEVLTNPNSKGPSLDWLNFVVSSGAKQQIRTFFKKQSKDTNIKLGKEILELESKKCGYSLQELLTPGEVSDLLARFNLMTIEDIFAAVGYGGITSKQVLGHAVGLRKTQEKLQRKKELALSSASKPQKDNNAVIVDGKKGISVRFGGCCHPIAGDEIVAFSSARGITVHKKDCRNVKGISASKEIQVCWEGDSKSMFVVTMTALASDANLALVSITNLLSNLKVNIVSITSKLNSSNESLITLKISVANRQNELFVKQKLKQLETIYNLK
ncbi:MAG: bifunctional (p)ppGpp synthetase/guanosine-3',5'-bis(diphosphate) 3'-pyrophosphohydrolase [Clostridia bacterium]|nr:bifunctional (p)ppGpp synthetase/guanosine-3',5'-bis(diphosphate) 3'-pyrophosphohydrolase [Clostridia bacterium]